jgi:hypothetical protein
VLTILRIIKKIFFLFIIIAFIVFLLSQSHIYKKEELSYGITFSKKQADSLGLNWKKAYLASFDDLGVKKIRLSAYWDEVEKNGGEYLWDDIDWQIKEGEKRDVKIILAFGGRLPRWPECHFPQWAQELDQAEREDKILRYIKAGIERYKDNNNIVAWQIENEPFLSHFGNCPKLDKSFLDKEIALVREIDPRPIVITDSGELSVWVQAARRADVFGTTMYRDTYSSYFKRYIHYPIGPWFFRAKKNLVSIFAHPKEWIVIELQAEPWTPIPYQNASRDERDKTMNIDKFKEMIEFSSQTGFKEFYLWGAEYWYWEKEVNNNFDIWEEARGLF